MLFISSAIGVNGTGSVLPWVVPSARDGTLGDRMRAKGLVLLLEQTVALLELAESRPLRHGNNLRSSKKAASGRETAITDDYG